MVIKKLGAVNYLIKKNDRTPAIVVHADKLKACQAPLQAEVLRVGRCTASVNSNSPELGNTHSEGNVVVADNMEAEGLKPGARRRRRVRRGPGALNGPGTAEGPRGQGQQPKSEYICITCAATIIGYKAWKQHSRRCAARVAASQPWMHAAPEVHPVWLVRSAQQMEPAMIFAPEVRREGALMVAPPPF